MTDSLGKSIGNISLLHPVILELFLLQEKKTLSKCFKYDLKINNQDRIKTEIFKSFTYSHYSCASHNNVLSYASLLEMQLKPCTLNK